MEAVTTGTVALIAREIGKGRPDEAARVLRTALALAAGARRAADARDSRQRHASWAAMGVAPEVVSLGGRCLRILLAFSIPVAVGATLAMGLRGAGDVRTPLAIGIVTNLVNVVACWVLIFGRLGAPELGAEGSVWASGLSFSVGALLLLWLWQRGTPGAAGGSLARDTPRRGSRAACCASGFRPRSSAARSSSGSCSSCASSPTSGRSRSRPT